jgi:DNA-binding MarR family transcriptional regulator
MKKHQKGFKYNVPNNAKAILEFENQYQIDAKKINLKHYHVLSFIAEICLKKRKSNKLISEMVNGKEYHYMSSSFILGNLPLLKIQKRSLVRLLDDLEKKGYIERIILEKTKRHVRITDALKHHYLQEHKDSNEDPLMESLVDLTARTFSLTSTNQKSNARQFILTLDEPEFYKQQLDSYSELKAYSNEYVHTFARFKEIWDSQDWSLVLEKRKHQDLVRQMEKQF